MATQKIHPHLTKSRVGWTLIATFALGITLLAATIPVPRVAVALKVELDEVGFQFKDDWDIYDLSLSELSVVNARRVELVGDLAGSSGESAPAGRPKKLAIVSRPGVSAWSAWLSSDHLQMNLSVPARAETRLSLVGGDASSLQINVDGNGMAASLDIGEELHVRCGACLMLADEVEQTLSAGQSSWRLRPARRTVSLLGADAPLMLNMRVKQSTADTTQLAADAGLRALSVDFQRAVGGAPVSAIRGPGTIAFPGLETDPVALEPGDFLVISVAEPLEVRRISVDTTIQVELRGYVSAVAVGPGGALRSKKPTLLQYVYWNPWLQMVLGGALTLGATISSLLYRFGFLTKTAG